MIKVFTHIVTKVGGPGPTSNSRSWYVRVEGEAPWHTRGVTPLEVPSSQGTVSVSAESLESPED